MPFTHINAIEAIARMAPAEEAKFLARLGHWFTVIARDCYEFQAPGVVNPIKLRQINEIQHRVFAQIAGLVSKGERIFDPVVMVAWLTAEECDIELQDQCLEAFSRVYSRHLNQLA
jgi:hypothetical protein